MSRAQTMNVAGRFAMLSLRKSRRASFLLVGLSCLAGIAGCHRGPVMYHVQGKVMYKDGSAPRGSLCIIRFQPTKESKAEVRKGATSDILPDGSFELMTRKPRDGAYEGEYDVVFAIEKSDTDRQSLVSPKYTQATTTPYKVTVDRNLNDLRFEIEPATAAESGGTQGNSARDSAKNPPSG